MCEMDVKKLQELINQDTRCTYGNQRWQIGDKIGDGGVGIVYKIYGSDGKAYALKVVDVKQTFKRLFSLTEENFSKKHERYQDFCHKCEEEFKIGQSVDHPHLLKIINKVEILHKDELLILMFMPYMPSTLEAIKNLLDYNEAMVLEIALQCCQGLKELRRNDFVHRDIKPDNIFYIRENEKTNFMLGDYSIARHLDPTATEGKTTLWLGTKEYMAPENAFGVYSFLSDIYSMGKVIYWLCNEYEVSPVNSDKPIARMKNGSDALWHVVQKAMAFKPEDRYQNVFEMILDLDAVKETYEQNLPEQKLKEVSNHNKQLNQKLALSMKEIETLNQKIKQLQSTLDKEQQKYQKKQDKLQQQYQQEKDRNQILETQIHDLQQQNQALKQSQTTQSLKLNVIDEQGGFVNRYFNPNRIEEKMFEKSGKTDFYKGKISEYGMVKEVDIEEAKNYYIESYQKGYMPSAIALADLYRMYGSSQELNQAIQLYQEVIQQGYIEAYEGLYNIYSYKLPDKQMLKECLVNWEKTQSPKAYYYLGNIYEAGALGFTKDHQKAKDYYSKAYQLQDPKSGMALAKLYLKENRGSQAITIYKQLANQNNCEAMVALAKYYQKIDLKKYQATIIDYYQKAKQQIKVQELQNWGVFKFGTKLEELEPKDAKNTYEHLAILNPIYNQQLGLMYEFGLGVDVDFQKAIHYYEESGEGEAYIGAIFEDHFNNFQKAKAYYQNTEDSIYADIRLNLINMKGNEKYE